MFSGRAFYVAGPVYEIEINVGSTYFKINEIQTSKLKRHYRDVFRTKWMLCVQTPVELGYVIYHCKKMRQLDKRLASVITDKRLLLLTHDMRLGDEYPHTFYRTAALTDT